ncbi:Acetoin:2,6-dichlorophenolindophenol oxidoreductase subunit alpha [bacterium HR40]|nr:Acetoin:2,6-dichlorophenolindophenol oxidoreductase subunit alpha [bacterium HR40]
MTAARKSRRPEAGSAATVATSEEKLPPLDKLLAFYRDMLLIRRFEEKAGQLYGMGLIGGFCHLYIGQEAVATGIVHALAEGDSIITSYRDHGHMLVCGMDPRRVMAELTGRVTGYSKGKGGSMHMFARERGFYGGHGIVGAPVPLGTGLAFAHKYRGDGHICATFFGEGAANQGQVYEAFNMAALWKLPVLYVIENNRYAMGTPLTRATASTELYRRGEAFAIPGDQVDGMNVIAVYNRAVEAVAHVRDHGPFILEALTYRYRGHSMSDPAKYRTREEVEQYRKYHDPIEQLRRLLLEKNLVDEGRLRDIDREIRDIVNEAARFAQDSPEPEPDELWTDVYVEA